MSFSLVTVTGTFLEGSGEPATGSVTATLETTIRNGLVQVEPVPIVGKLDNEGRLVNQAGLPFELTATDDAGTTPPGCSYHWLLEIAGLPSRTFYAPLSKVINPVDLEELEPSR